MIAPMDSLRWIGRRLRGLLFRGRIERAMSRELQQHLDEDIADRIANGARPDDARRDALIAFGGLERIKEDARDARGGRVIEDVMLDLRYAVRILRRNAGVTAVAVLTFALGTGAATAIFSVVYGVLVRPLPYRAPQELVALWERNIPRNKDQIVVSIDSYDGWQTRARGFSGMAALMPAAATIVAGGESERVPGAEVTPGYFSLLGVPPAFGRDFTDADAQADDAVVLSHGYWTRRFGGDASIVGRAVTIGGKPRTVVGIMPASFEPPRLGWLGEQQLWLPMTLSDSRRAWGRFLIVIARLSPGTTMAAARADLTALAAERARASAANQGWSVSVIPLSDQVAGGARTALLVELCAVALLLVMAVTNVAMLTMTAMQQRARELAVRRAIGATDGRLFRQLFTQSALVGVVGAVSGILLAFPATRLLVAFLPPDMPRMTSIAVDWPVWLVMASVTLAATLIFGTVAARRGRAGSQQSLVGGDATGARSTTRSASGSLVGAEIALGLTVSIMALLMVRSFLELQRVDLGFDPRGVIAGRVSAPTSKYDTAELQREFFRRTIAALEAVPGVEAAAVISARPLGGIGPATTVADPQAPPIDRAAAPVIDVRFAETRTFAALKIPLLSGAGFDPATETAGPPSVVISASLARQVWPGQDPLGRSLRMGVFNDVTATVAGVVGDVHLVDARTPERPAAYLSAARFADAERDLVVRTSLAPDVILPALRAAINSVEPGLPLYRVTTMSALADQSLASDRFTTFLLSAFAAVALTLAGIGIFGVFSSDVVYRRKEIGLRLALGGSARSVMMLLLQKALRRSAAGIGVGLAIAVGLARGMSSLLFGVTALDPVSIAGAIGAIALLATVATLIPAARALGASPLAALRDQ
jgi:putative ABC transport system permease protein